MNILIIDQSKEISSRLKDLLLENTNCTSVTETNSFSKASAILDSLQPDIILLEFDLQINGLFSFLTQIKKMNPNSKIIALYIRYKNDHLKLNNISDVDYLFDKYEEFEKIPGAIKEIIANNEKNSYIY